MKAIEILRTAAALLPVLASTVQAVEVSLPPGTDGAKKMEAVRLLLQTAYESEQTTAVAFAQVWPVLQVSIAAIVAANNTAGVFKKRGEPATTN